MNDIVADVMTVHVVDALEVVDVEHDGRQYRAAFGTDAGIFGLHKERPAVENSGQGVSRRKFEQFALHRPDALGRAQPGVEFLDHRRLSDKVVGAIVERLDQLLPFLVRGHQDDVDRPAAARELPDVAAQFHAGDGGLLGAGDERVDRRLGPDVTERLCCVDKSVRLMVARFQEACDNPQHGAARIDQHHIHGSCL